VSGLLDLPRGDGRLHLRGIAAAASFLACLALAFVVCADALSQRLRAELGAALTIEVAAGPELEARVDAALARLRAAPGVAEASRLPPERMRALLAPWLGEAEEVADLPLPALVELRLLPGGGFPRAELEAELRAAVPGLSFDDHASWREALLRLDLAAALLSGGVLLAVGLAGMAAVALATHARLAARREQVEILHLMGARDARIMAEIAADAARLGASGAAIGAALAAALVAAAAFVAGPLPPGALPAPAPDPASWALLALPVPVAALLAAATAAWATRAALRRMP
jgi:cell division transport system permease protein